MASKRISIGTWSYIRGARSSDPIPLPIVVKHLHALRFDGLELSGLSSHMHPREFPSRARRKEVKALLDDHGLRVSGLAPDFSRVPPALVVPPAYLEVVQANLDICHDLDISTLRVDTVSPSMQRPGGADLDTCFSRIAETWNRAAHLCASEGIRIAWEFEAALLFNKPSEILRMLQAVDHANFTVLFDFFHAFMCGVIGAQQMGDRETLPGGVAQFAHMLTGKIGLVHFSDCDRKAEGGDTITGTRTPFGAGSVDFAEVIHAVLEAGYAGEWWPIDLGGSCGDALEEAPPAKRFMDDLVARYG